MNHISDGNAKGALLTSINASLECCKRGFPAARGARGASKIYAHPQSLSARVHIVANYSASSEYRAVFYRMRKAIEITVHLSSCFTFIEDQWPYVGFTA